MYKISFYIISDLRSKWRNNTSIVKSFQACSLFSYVFKYQSWTLYFFFFFTSHNIFVSVMESLRIPISKMKRVLITPYRSGLNFFVDAVAKLSNFKVEKEFKANQNVLWNMMLVFLILSLVKLQAGNDFTMSI